MAQTLIFSNHNDPGNPEATGVQIYHNTMDMQITRLGGEYGASTYPGPAAPTASNEFAVGVRSTTGIKNSSIYNNNITVRSFSNYSANYSPTGEPVIISGADAAKGIMVGLRWNDESLNVYGNIISAIDSDGSGEAIGISCSANMDDRYGYLYPQSQGYYIPKSDFRPALNIYSNTITSNLTNIAIGDEYGGCDGYPAIYNNILIKSGNFNSYATYGIGQGFYYGPSYAWLLGNTYSGGAAESSQAFNFADSSHVDTTSPPDYSTGTTHFYRGKDIIFGDVVSGAASLRYSEDNAGGTTESNTPNVTTPPSNSLSLTLPLVPSTSSAPPIVSAYPAPGPYATLPTVYLTCIPQGTASCEPIVYCTGSGCTPSTTYDPDGNGTGITLSGTTTIGYKDTDFNGDAGTTVYGTYTLFLGNTTPPTAPSGLSVI